MSADRSKIEWTDATWNPIRARNRASGKVGHFCEHASEGCRWCYAERLQPRFGNPVRYARQDRDKVEIFLDEAVLLQPLRFSKPRMIFPCSMTDLFGEWVPDEWLDRIFAVMAQASQHVFQVLTKRSARMQRYMTGVDRAARIVPIACLAIPQVGKEVMVADATWPLPNVWVGISCEDQKTADERIPDLLATPAAVRWASAEPLLGPIDFHEVIPDPLAWNFAHGFDGLDWIVAGGESGHQARPMHPDWARSIRDQCAAAGVPFLFKQWGEWLATADDDGQISYGGHERHGWDIDGHNEAWAYRVGKHAAGRRLDGVEHDGYPGRWGLSHRIGIPPQPKENTKLLPFLLTNRK